MNPLKTAHTFNYFLPGWIRFPALPLFGMKPYFTKKHKTTIFSSLHEGLDERSGFQTKLTNLHLIINQSHLLTI